MFAKTEVVFVDIASQDKIAREKLPEGQQEACATRVIQVTIHQSIDAALDAIGEGATGYWLSSDAVTEMVGSIDAARHAGQVIDADAIEQRVAAAPVEAENSEAFRELSRREFQVLRLVVNGKTSSQIAAELHLSPKTIDTYRSRLMQKLNVPDLPRLVRLAIREGMLPDD